MNKADYLRTQETILALVFSVKNLPLEDFVSAADHAETMGPILDPALYRAASERLRKIKRLAIALRQLQKLAAKEFPEESNGWGHGRNRYF